jgi:hypothetical protein
MAITQSPPVCAVRAAHSATRARLLGVALCLLAVVLWGIERAPAPDPLPGSGLHGFERDAAGLRGSNAVEGFSESFTSASAAIEAGRLRVGLRLDGAGGAHSISPLARTMPVLAAGKVLYRQGSISEWYANRATGLEQGFTLTRRPRSASTDALSLSLAVSGNAEASLTHDRRSVIFTREGAGALVYGGLRATDARGRNLPARLALGAGHLLLLIDTAHASYPVSIDPLLQQ